MVTAAKKPAPKAPRKDTVSQAALADKYGTVKALIDTNPELKALFAKAYGTGTSGQWTPARFQAALKQTKWFQTHSDQWRKTEALRVTDKATYQASINASVEDTKRMAAQMGSTITDAQALALGTSFYRGNYSSGQQQKALADFIGVGDPNGLGGAAGKAEQTLKGYGADMGINMSDSWYLSAEKSVASGLSTVEDWMGDIKIQAKSLYTPFADRIEQGMSVKDLSSSYVNQMAQTLEIDPSSINLQDQTIQKALKGTVDQKSGIPTTQPLWEFDQGLKQDPRWAMTKNANQLANQTAMNVLQSMGFQS